MGWGLVVFYLKGYLSSQQRNIKFLTQTFEKKIILWGFKLDTCFGKFEGNRLT